MKSILMLLLMLSINVMLFLGQVSVINIAEEVGVNPPQFFDLEGTPLASYDSGNYTTPDNIALPESDASTRDTTGNPFTDLWATVSNWAIDNPIGRFVTAFPAFLSITPLPPEAIWAFGAMWYGVALFAFITWIKGGGD